MCGRFTQTAKGPVLADLFQLAGPVDVEPRYNIAPTQQAAAVRVSPETGRRELGALRWGLVPSWAKDPKVAAKHINARSETVADKPSYRAAFRKRRCLVPADGYYEWQKLGARKKQPYYIRLRDEAPFGFAGLWESWEGEDGELIESFTILTTAANELVRPLHERMPVIVSPTDFALWLDPAEQKPELVQPLLAPYPPEQMK